MHLAIRTQYMYGTLQPQWAPLLLPVIIKFQDSRNSRRYIWVLSIDNKLLCVMVYTMSWIDQAQVHNRIKCALMRRIPHRSLLCSRAGLCQGISALGCSLGLRGLVQLRSHSTCPPEASVYCGGMPRTSAPLCDSNEWVRIWKNSHSLQQALYRWA